MPVLVRGLRWGRTHRTQSTTGCGTSTCGSRNWDSGASRRARRWPRRGRAAPCDPFSEPHVDGLMEGAGPEAAGRPGLALAELLRPVVTGRIGRTSRGRGHARTHRPMSKKSPWIGAADSRRSDPPARRLNGARRRRCLCATRTKLARLAAGLWHARARAHVRTPRT